MPFNKADSGFGHRIRYLGKLLQTGQTTQYSSKEDDGYYEKGISKSYTVLSTGQYAGTTDITLNAKTHALSNNCVTDNRTGLMWARYVPTADIGPDADGKLLWIDDTNNEDIFDFADQTNAQALGGHSDWRVPNYFELFSLLDLSRYGDSPIIDHVVFPSTPSAPHWTSSIRPETDSAAMYVDFLGALGIYDTKTTGKHYCRLVRGG